MIAPGNHTNFDSLRGAPPGSQLRENFKFQFIEQLRQAL